MFPGSNYIIGRIVCYAELFPSTPALVSRLHVTSESWLPVNSLPCKTTFIKSRWHARVAQCAVHLGKSGISLSGHSNYPGDWPNTLNLPLERGKLPYTIPQSTVVCYLPLQLGLLNPWYLNPTSNDVVILKFLNADSRLWRYDRFGAGFAGLVIRIC